jgi:hypothetical protein
VLPEFRSRVEKPDGFPNDEWASLMNELQGAYKVLSNTRRRKGNITKAQRRVNEAICARDAAVAKFQQQRAVQSVNDHTTQETDRVVMAIEANGKAIAEANSNAIDGLLSGRTALHSNLEPLQEREAILMTMKLLRIRKQTLDPIIAAEAKAKAAAKAAAKAKAKALAVPATPAPSLSTEMQEDILAALDDELEQGTPSEAAAAKPNNAESSAPAPEELVSAPSSRPKRKAAVISESDECVSCLECKKQLATMSSLYKHIQHSRSHAPLKSPSTSKKSKRVSELPDEAVQQGERMESRSSASTPVIQVGAALEPALEPARGEDVEVPIEQSANRRKAASSTVVGGLRCVCGRVCTSTGGFTQHKWACKAARNASKAADKEHAEDAF